jgi:formamidopyrimidine-DNA glycosylase
MPELPEVETTTRGLQKEIVGLKIKDVWTDLNSKDARQTDAVKNAKYFPYFKKEVSGQKILSAKRRAKNILIHLSGEKTILIHMKMTGHLLYGKYIYNKKENKWYPEHKDKTHPLHDPYNRFVHVVFVLSNGKHLAFCDSRKFGKITLLETKTMNETKHLFGIGPEPLDEDFTLEKFKQYIHSGKEKRIKNVLMDPSIIAGIGNIYSDEILWRAGINPERKAKETKNEEIKLMYKAMKEALTKGIDFGGDSMSDYRNIYGMRGEFQLHHDAYRRTGEKCRRKNCTGVIIRKVVGGRSAHFCSIHQK